MKLSWSGFRFGCCREARSSVAYADGIGKHADGTEYQKYSWGFGSQEPPPILGQRLPEIEAFRIMKAHYDRNDVTIARALEPCLREGSNLPPLMQQHWDAIASLFYQRGSRALEAVAAHFNEGERSRAMMEFANWNSGQDGVPTEGHSNRRALEIKLGTHGDYDDISRYKFFDGPPKTTPVQWLPFPSPSEIGF
jgi:GH24 family phage-related lysozyme (muramidase)